VVVHSTTLGQQFAHGRPATPAFRTFRSPLVHLLLVFLGT
jgi:hypothetical protein